MGVDLNAIKALNYLRNKNINFGQTITLGRQGLWIKPKNIYKGLTGRSLELKEKLEKLSSFNFAEDLFKIFGSDAVTSIDFSDYEGATIVHDMNIPINTELKNKYDIVFDGGTLEHIFNFPQAIKNCMEMIKVGGYFLSITCCNNLSGHGFYQFSPELFFRVFSKENGFSETEIFISENKFFGNKCIWYKVKDPEEVKSRVMFWNSVATSIIIISKKVEDKEIFIKQPYQSDYVSLWKSENKSNNIKVELPLIFSKINRLYKYYFIKYDKRYFQKVK